MSSTSPPAATTPAAATDSSSDSAIPPPRRLVWSEVRTKGSKSPKADKDRAKVIFDWMKAECLPLVIAQERESKESAVKAGRRDKYIQQEIYPKVDRQFEISGPNGFMVGDFQKQIVKCFSNWIREAKAADAKAEAKVGPPLPATVGGQGPSKVKVAPRLRKKNALDMYKKDYRTDIRQAVADAKAKAKAAAKARGEEGEEDDDDDDGDDDDDEDGQDGVKVEEGGKAKRLTLFNSVAAKLFEGVGGDIKEAMEVRATEVNGELVNTPTEDAIVQNQDRLGDTVYNKLARLIGHGPKQVGDAVFVVRWAVKRPDGRLKYMRLSISKNRSDVRFKEGPEQDGLFRTWARSNLSSEAAVASDEADLEQDSAPPPPPPAPVRPSASTSDPAIPPMDNADCPADFSPGMLKLAPAAGDVAGAAAGASSVAPSALPGSETPPVVVAAAAAGDVAGAGAAAGASSVAPSALPGSETPPVVVAAAAAGDVAGAGAAAGASSVAPSALPGSETPPVVVAAAAAGDLAGAGAGASGAGTGGKKGNKKGKKAKGKAKAVPKAKAATTDAHPVNGAKRKADGDAEGAPAPKKKKTAAVVAPAVPRPKRTRAEDPRGTLTEGRREGKFFYTLNSPLLPPPFSWDDDFVKVWEIDDNPDSTRDNARNVILTDL
ncbi:hypothetical protein C8R47DRAFT_1082960 [Mycena vitilis]|nr:hypothetical protein C8R47DRAFT_1082960 [Mycena vitilis]